MRYETPAALRQALEARLAAQAHADGVDLQRLRRGAVFERVLTRLERGAKGSWVVKGGMALELRFGQLARSTKDLDLAMRDADRNGADVREALIEALSKDPDGDGFEFRVGRSAALDADAAGRPGWRFSLDTYLAGRRFATVRLDVVARDEEITKTERVRLPGTLAFAGIQAIDVEAVHRVQQFAEKLHALTRTYAGERSSTRVKDLPDLMLLIEEGLEPTDELLAVTERVFALRGTHPVPTEILDPPADWDQVYAGLVEELDITPRTVGEALSQLRDFWAMTLTFRTERRVDGAT